MIKVLLADAQLLVREGLKSILSDVKDIKVICEAENRSQLSHCIQKHQVDVAIIDYSLESHFEVNDVGLIKQLSPETSVLVISSDNSRQNIYKVIEQGTQGYLTKECDREEVLDAIRATAVKQTFFCSKIVDIIVEKKELDKTEEGWRCEPASLTQRETEILKLIGHGLTTIEIADKLSLSVHTINTHRKNIFKKLNARTSADVVKFALGLN